MNACISASIDVKEDIQKIKVPDNWIFQQTIENNNQSSRWWELYGIQELNQLIDDALQHNQNVRSAAIDWQRALLGIKQNKAQKSVQLQSTIGGSKNILGVPSEAKEVNYSGQFNISYQLDLWNKLALSEHNANSLALASAEDLLAAQLSLIGEIISAYVQLAWLDERIALLNTTTFYHKETLQRMQIRHQLGNLSKLELTRSEQRHAQQEIELNRLLVQRTQQVMQIAHLIGKPPEILTLNPPKLSAFRLPEINIPLPAYLLSQRPDLRAAQYRLQQQLGQLKIAESAFYPDINLNLSVSSNAKKLLNLVENPVGSIAGAITLPFLQYQQLSIQKKQQRYSYEHALIQFEQLLYKALNEVNQALLDRQKVDKELNLLQRELALVKQVEGMVKESYLLGAESLQSYLDAQQNTRDSQLGLLNLQYQTINAHLKLSLTVGGYIQ